MVKINKSLPFLRHRPLSPKSCKPRVLVQDTQKDLKISCDSAEKLTLFLIQKFKLSTNEISIHFVSSKQICKIHADFFDDPTSTDCISFPIDAPGAKVPFHVLGEVFVCPKVAIGYAQEHGIDPYEETSRYIVHGLLHLLGYEDEEESLAKKMKAQENKCVTLLKKHNLLLKNSAFKV